MRLCIVTLATQARLCSPPYGYGWSIAWSPDSTKLVLNGYADHQNTLYFLFLDDNSVHQYRIPGEENRQPITFDWSPDSTQVAFLPVPGEIPVMILKVADILAQSQPE